MHASADVFSLGVVLLALLTRLPDRQIESIEDATYYRETHLQRFPYGTDREVIALIRRMLGTNPEERPSTHEIEVACRRMRRWIDGPCLAEWVSDEVLPHALSASEEGSLTDVQVTVPGPLILERILGGGDLRIPAIHQPFDAPLWVQE